MLFAAFILLFLLPLLTIALLASRVRPNKGPTCPRCRYNLFKCTSSECPECGFNIEKKGVLPPHKIDRLSLWLSIIVYWIVTLVLSAVAVNVVRHLGHRAYGKAYIAFDYPLSCAYRGMVIKLEGKGTRWGSLDYLDNRHPPKIPVRHATILVMDQAGDYEMRVDFETMTCEYNAKVQTEPFTIEAMLNWMKLSGVAKPKDHYRHYLIWGSDDDVKPDKLKKMPVGDLDAELEMVMDFIDWSLNPSTPGDSWDPQIWYGERQIKTNPERMGYIDGPFRKISFRNSSSRGGLPRQYREFTFVMVWMCFPAIVWWRYRVWRIGILKPWFDFRRKHELLVDEK